VGDQTHAMLAFPSFASFDVNASSPVTCLTADVVDGQRIVICRGTQSTTFNLKVCGDADNCLEFPVALQPCPLLQAGTTTPLVTSTPFAPVFLTPIPPIKKTREPASTSTPVAVPATPTSPPATSYP
jgi:hypothetical protein